MDWIRRWVTQIQAQLAGLTVSQKLLLGTLGFTVPMMLWVVVSYAGSPQMVPVLGSAQALEGDSQSRIIAYLDMNEIPYEQKASVILVPAERRASIVARLAMQELLPEDTSEGFESYLTAQDWWVGNSQRKQHYDIALQNELSRIIGSFKWVGDAKVIISRPQNQWFDAPKMHPTASVTMRLAGGRLNQKQADAVARLVSGAVAEMRAEDVNVIDSIAGRTFNVQSDDDYFAGDHFEMRLLHEKHLREKILMGPLLGIKGASVAVNVKVKADKITRRSKDFKPEGKGTENLVKRAVTETDETTAPAVGGEPGVRSNAGLNIAGESAGGGKQSRERREEDFSPFAGSEEVVTHEARGTPEKITASVNVPRSYVEALYKKRNPQATGDVSEANVQAAFAEIAPRLRTNIGTLLQSASEQDVVIGMYADGLLEGAPEGPVAAASGGFWTGTVISNGLMALLALVALGAMFMMIRRAAQPQILPTAEELANLPETIDAQEAAIGEVVEAPAAMMGVELDDDTLAHQQIVDQVSDMARENPEEVASMVKWWMRQEE